MLEALWPGLVRDTFFCFITSLASGDVMGKLGSIVVVNGCGDGIVVSRIMGAPPSGRSVPVVCHDPVILLTFCCWRSSLILRLWVVGAFWPSSSCSRPCLPHLYGVLCCH